MESNGLAVHAVTQGKGDGRRARACIYGEECLGVWPLLAADGVKHAIRPESQTGDRLATHQTNVRADACRGRSVTSRRVAKLPVPVAVCTTAKSFPSFGRAAIDRELNMVKPASVTCAWFDTLALAGLI